MTFATRVGCERIHLMVPVVYSGFGTIIRPFSLTFVISKTARTDAHAMNKKASAKCIPNQRLSVGLRIRVKTALYLDKFY